MFAPLGFYIPHLVITVLPAKLRFSPWNTMGCLLFAAFMFAALVFDIFHSG